MIRVLIERWLLPDMEDSFRAAMREMRRDAVYASGYIGGETLRDVAAPGHYVVISTWRSRADWDAWAVSAARDVVRDRIRPMLAEEERTTVLEPV
jgi:heme-degrading monooxygenase HmoA